MSFFIIFAFSSFDMFDVKLNHSFTLYLAQINEEDDSGPMREDDNTIEKVTY